jgi:hypothetical protein
MQSRSMGDKALKSTYCPLALGADTNMFLSYKSNVYEGYCGEVNQGARFYTNEQGYKFNPGTGPQVNIPPTGIKEGYCAGTTAAPCGCSGRGANAVFQGAGDVPPCSRKNRSGFIGIFGV